MTNARKINLWGCKNITGDLSSLTPCVSLDELQLTIDDTARRAHVLTLSLPPDYPARSPVARVIASKKPQLLRRKCVQLCPAG